jgi:hypothetical protein
VKLGDGETFANKLIDQRADGAAFSIKATGGGWAVKNVGFKGAGSLTDFGFHLRVACPDGGEGLIENVYCNNKQKAEPMGFSWEQGRNEGTIQLRHTYVEGFGNNAAYMTNANKRGRAGGAVHHEYCYHVDNTPANFRPGGNGSVIKDCVSVIDDPNHERAFYTDGSSDKARGTWPSHTTGIEMENVHFYTNPDDANPGAYFALRHEDISDGNVVRVTANNCKGNLSQNHPLFESHEGNTDLTVNNYQQGKQTVKVLGEGVPLTPEMAAKAQRKLPPELPKSTTGGGDDSQKKDEPDGPTLDRTLTIDGTNADRTDYEFTVSETVENDPNNGSFGQGDSTDGNTASGFVNGGVDGYRFSGEVTDATVTGNAAIRVDGQPFDVGQFSASPTIDTYEVTEAGSKNVDANILANWGVSDGDGDLSTVTVEVLDSGGAVVDATENGVSGATAYGVNYFRITDVDGQSFTVRATVADSTGNQSTKEQSVQE